MAADRPGSACSVSSFKEEIMDKNSASPESTFDDRCDDFVIQEETTPKAASAKRTFFSIDDILSDNFDAVKISRPIVRPWDLPQNLSPVTRVNKSDKAKAKGSPLDALLKMANKTFEGLEKGDSRTGAHSPDNCSANSSNNSSKKKRKSRTAFTNTQVFELEKRFIFMKYLSPADRDEIAQSLGLSNAQVITWFQNRRAKSKRDHEELKKDVTATQLHTLQRQLYDNHGPYSMGGMATLLRAKCLSDAAHVKRFNC